MLLLPDVTLVCADTLNHALAARALARCCERIRFGRAVFLTDAAPPDVRLPDEVETRRIAPIATRDAYSTLMLKGLAGHVGTSHALVVQWDGYAMHPEAWDDAFLAFDYCGAPWPWGEPDRRVGNGGFSLRSRRLIDALASPEVVLRGNEDETIGVHARDSLESRHGIRFAPVDVASRFSFEVAYPAGKPFGFHGLFNFCRVESEDEITALAPTFSDAIARSPQLVSLMRNCAAMGLWRATQAIATRILGAEPSHVEAGRTGRASREALARGAAIGRNDRCPCGSGKRYKQCHGAIDAPVSPSPIAEDPDVLARRGASAHAEGRIEEAESAYRAALALSPGHTLADHYLGVVETHRGRLDDATPRLERTAAARPADPDFQVHLGLAYAAADRLDDAIACYRRAIDRGPGHAGAWNNLGLALQQQNRLDDAIASFGAALAIAPADDRVRWNLGTARLGLGDREGWNDYEARHSVPELGGRVPPVAMPRLDSVDVEGRTIVLDAEQGHGDTLQFVRFAGALAAAGATVVVRAPAILAGLLRTVPGVAEVVAPEVRPAGDAWLPLASMPRLFGASPQGTDAPPAPYLFADPSIVAAVREALEPRRGRLAVGLAWAGNPRHPNDRRRSCPLAALAPLIARADVDWVSLQHVDGEDQIPGVREASRLLLPDARHDFDRKAALMTQLDLVVSVDTSIAHLAGALGLPVWILLPFAAEWRWGVSGATTGWYRSARLFRQPGPGAWDATVRALSAAFDAEFTA
ncbi:MAG: DUF5672 family protein [Betaproteobacteria bacterium]